VAHSQLEDREPPEGDVMTDIVERLRWNYMLAFAEPIVVGCNVSHFDEEMRDDGKRWAQIEAWASYVVIPYKAPHPITEAYRKRFN
jgi:methionine-rich copper-binding protein CopC